MNQSLLSRSGLSSSLLGLGTMRLPLEDPRNSASVGQNAIQMIRRAVDRGINYIDTAYPYHQGQSEVIVGQALKDGYRDRVILTTKLPIWKCEHAGDPEHILNEQLKKLQTDHLDYYFLHALDQERWNKLLDLDIFSFLDRIQKDGRVRNVGFSFHDEYPVFEQIIRAYPWSLCQIQYNLIDEHYQAGIKGLHLAASHGIDVAVMEPLRGGALAVNVPQDVRALWQSAKIQRPPHAWAFRWLAAQPEVKIILSGMSTNDQVDENIALFSEPDFNVLTEAESTLIQKVQAAYQAKIKVPCTGCEYCLPCPQKVAIPTIFNAYNACYLFETPELQQRRYQSLVDNGEDASACVACGQCEAQCPQHIEVISKLKEAAKVLDRR